MSAARPPPAVRLPALEPYADVSDVLEGLGALEDAFLETRDRRGVFVLAYRRITATIGDWLAGGRFRDPAAVGRYVAAFANAYRRALADDEAGRPARVPAAWRLCFEAARTRRTGVVQDLLLGINAHINHDLPFAILDAGIDATCERCHRDHDVVNEALQATTARVRLEVVRRYAPALGLPARLAGRSLDRALAAVFRRVRERSWQTAAALQATGAGTERRRLARAIEARAARVGASILADRAPTRRRFAMLCGGGDLRDAATLPA